MCNARDMSRFTRRAWRCFCAVILLSVAATSSHAQILQARWVEESEARIEKIRKADLRIIIIDQAGNPVARGPVRIEQLQHAFRWGVRLPRELPDDLPTKERMAEAPLWRSFNAVSLDAHTQWPVTQPRPGEWDFAVVEKLFAFAKERNLSARWGGVISTDPGRMPDWAAGLTGDDLRAALDAHAKEVVRRFGRQVEQLDVVTQLIDHDHIEKELGFAAIRRLYQISDYERTGSTPRADATPTFARSMLAFDDAFAPARLQKALRQVTAFREGFVPFDAMAIEVRFAGGLVEAPITRNLQWLGDPGLPVTVASLEVSGDSPAEASINLETALRAMFSQPCVEGIYFAGLRSGDLQHEEAALIDEDGSLTPSGELIDRMVRRHWWTDITADSDDLGNVRRRIFAGAYRISVKLPDGGEADVQLRISAGQSKLVLLQPVKAKPGGTPLVKKTGTDDEEAIAPEPSLIQPVVDASFEPVKKEAQGDKNTRRDGDARPIPERSRLEFVPEQ